MSDFLPLSSSSNAFARELGRPPSGWPGDDTPESIAESVADALGPDTDTLPADPPEPEDEEELPEDTPTLPQAALVRVADEVLDPVALLPSTDILAKLEALPVVIAAQSRAVELVTAAVHVGKIVTAEDRTRADALRDDCKAHQVKVEEFLGPLCDAANKLHKGATGIRSFCLGDVQIAAKRLGDGIAASYRAEQDAEAARQRIARDKALADERARLKAEADAAEAESRQKAQEAEEARRLGDRETADLLKLAAEEEARIAAQARQEAATATAPAVATREVEKPEDASVVKKFKPLPAHAEDPDDMPMGDKVALIVAVAARIQAGDNSCTHFLDVSWKALRRAVTDQGETFTLAGIRVVPADVYRKTAR